MVFGDSSMRLDYERVTGQPHVTLQPDHFDSPLVYPAGGAYGVPEKNRIGNYRRGNLQENIFFARNKSGADLQWSANVDPAS